VRRGGAAAERGVVEREAGLGPGLSCPAWTARQRRPASSGRARCRSSTRGCSTCLRRGSCRRWAPGRRLPQCRWPGRRRSALTTRRARCGPLCVRWRRGGASPQRLDRPRLGAARSAFVLVSRAASRSARRARTRALARALRRMGRAAARGAGVRRASTLRGTAGRKAKMLGLIVFRSADAQAVHHYQAARAVDGRGAPALPGRAQTTRPRMAQHRRWRPAQRAAPHPRAAPRRAAPRPQPAAAAPRRPTLAHAARRKRGRAAQPRRWQKRSEPL